MIGSIDDYKIKLFDGLMNGCTLGGLLEIATEYLNYPIMALDNSTTLLAVTKKSVLERFSDDDSLYDLVSNGHCAYEFLVKYNIPETIELTFQKGTAFIIDTHFAVNMRRILAPIMIDHIMYGYLATFEIDRTFTDEDLLAMDLLAKACGMLIKNSGNYLSNKLSLSKSVLKSYLNGLITDSDAFLELYNSFMGKSYPYYYILCIKSIGQKNENSLGLPSLVEPLEKILPTALAFYNDSHIITLIGMEEKINEDIEKNIEQFLKSNNLQGGLSEWFSDSGSARKNYLQALEIVNVNPKQCERIHLMTLRNHYLQYCFTKIESVIDLRQLIIPEINLLLNYDKKNNTQFFETLCAYIKHNMNIIETADAMFLHRNTLRYRIKKISAIMDMDIEDYKNFNVLNLSVAATKWINNIKIE